VTIWTFGLILNRLSSGTKRREEDIRDTPEQNVSYSNKMELMPGHRIQYESYADAIRTPLDDKDKGYNYSELKSKNFLKLTHSDFEKRRLIGPSNRWDNIQTHYETMNNKENFGGDMDDIDEISEFIDENSRFVYTSEEDNDQQ
jgi:hypothetical protein